MTIVIILLLTLSYHILLSRVICYHIESGIYEVADSDDSCTRYKVPENQVFWNQNNDTLYQNEFYFFCHQTVGYVS